AGEPRSGVGSDRRRHGQKQVLTVARRDKQDALANVRHRIVDTHRADDHFRDEVVDLLVRIEEGGLQLGPNGIYGRAREHRLVWNHSEHFEPFAHEPAAGEVGHQADFVGGDFVEDDADDFNALFFEKGQVQSDFVDWLADAAARHDDDLG